MLKRILAGGLTAALAFSLLTGCDAPALDSSAPDTYEAKVPTAAQEDVDSYLTDGTISCADTVMTINGTDVPASAYFYWLSYYASYLEYYYQSSGGEDFSLSDQYDEDTTYADYVQEQTENTLISSVVATQKAQEEKVELSEDAQTNLDNMEENADPNTLLYYATDLDGLKFTFTNYSYSDALQTALFEKGGKYYANKETLQDYYDDNVFGAKHILIQTSGMSDEEKAEAKKTIQGYLDKILASDDQASTFDQYMNEHSEDSGLAQYPDGYTFMSGDMVSEFEDAVAALKVGEITPEVVESSYGYHIIMRIEPDPEEIDDETLKERYQEDTYSGLLDEWTQSAEISTSDALEKLDTNAFYDKLSSLQDIINAITEAENAANASSSAEASQQSAQ
ncbi:MAG: peptidylprolyl isomerase [Candidatus Onthomonas sp.]|nr:peptidylprolyl isomerase [Candidatus Onthomonas sp.]